MTDVDAAWEALVFDIGFDETGDDLGRRTVDKHRPIIEAAIRAEGLDVGDAGDFVMVHNGSGGIRLDGTPNVLDAAAHDVEQVMAMRAALPPSPETPDGE